MFPASVEDFFSENSVGLDPVPDNSILVSILVQTVQFVGVTI